MLRAFITFNLGVLRMPVGVKVWLLALIAANMIVPVFFISTREAQVVILTMLASLMLMTALTAGMTERQVRESGRPALVATRPMTRVSRAVEKGETQGFMKVLVDAETKQILGAAILGVAGDEVVASILNAMYAKAPYTVIQRAVHIHPTVSELIPTMLADLKPLNS